MKNAFLYALIAAPAVAMSTQVSAALVKFSGEELSGDDAQHTDVTRNLGSAEDLADAFDDDGLLDLTQLYKSDFEEGQTLGDDDGPLADSYRTTFGGFEKEDSQEDPTSAQINHIDGTDAILCPDCYLLVKDGMRGDPAQYLFDISAWNGTDTIDLSGFWEDSQGSISNVSLWSDREVAGPEPMTLGRLGAGLLGLGMAARRRASRHDA